MFTYFVNIHAHSSIKHAMKTQGKFESLELLQTKMGKPPSILFQSFAKKKIQKFRSI